MFFTQGFTEVSTRIIIRQLVDALVWLKSHKYSHNDIKPENILLDQHFIIRLADYGFVRTISDKCSLYSTGTPG